jgi:molybdopterin converting factor small subunit
VTIDVTAHYFAVFRERAGCETESVSTASRTAAEFFGEMADRHGFADARERCKVAINGSLSSWESALEDGDEVLFFPPVAGG